MHISKHHYSIELAKLNNIVYYLEPAISSNKKETKVWQPLPVLPNLNVITTHMSKLFELLRFKQRFLYNLITPFFIRRLLKNIKIDFDVLWCFETNLYSNLKDFNAAYIIFHPVDQVIYTYQRKIAQSADIVFYVTNIIYEQVKDYHDNVHFIHHGISSEFEQQAKINFINLKSYTQDDDRKIKIGYVGNLIRKEVNRFFFETIIRKHNTVKFHFWGPHNIEMSNIDGEDGRSSKKFISFLKSRKNVVLHGVKPPSEICREIPELDVFVFCAIKSKEFDASNSHKIIEYLSTGKVIVTHHVNTYANTDLFEMAEGMEVDEVASLFNRVISNLDKYNAKGKQTKRIEFALQNTYSAHILEIETIINNTL